MLKVLENTVLRKAFGPKREKGAGDWRKLYNEQQKYYWGDEIKDSEVGEACGTYGYDRHTEFRWVNLKQRDNLKSWA
jgi:hypothetical protein